MTDAGGFNFRYKQCRGCLVLFVVYDDGYPLAFGKYGPGLTHDWCNGCIDWRNNVALAHIFSMLHRLDLDTGVSQ